MVFVSNWVRLCRPQWHTSTQTLHKCLPSLWVFLSTELIKSSADPATNDTIFCFSKGTFPDPTTQAYPITTSISITTAKSQTTATPQTKGTTEVTSAVKTTVKATRTAKVTERLVWTV